MKKMVLMVGLLVGFVAGATQVVQADDVVVAPPAESDMWMNGACLDGCWNGSMRCYDGCEDEGDHEYQCHMSCNDDHIDCRAGCRLIFGGL
jgi:hypothetical protein